MLFERIVFKGAVVAALVLVPRIALAADCAHGNALDCYNQALQRLQAAQAALSAARKDIQGLENKITNLQQETMQVM
jgi:hypothetical protein